MPRLKGSADLLEDRRRGALALWDTGLSLNEVGRRIPGASSSVRRRLRARRRGGPDALRVRFSPGRTLKLGLSQRRRWLKLLLKGPQAHGYRTQLWTTARRAEVIRHEFGIEYHRDHVGRLMHSLSWSPQKPERRAVERDEEAIKRWKRKDWPRIKKRRPAGRPPGFCRRIGLLVSSLGRPNLGTARFDSSGAPSSRATGQSFCHLRNFGQPSTTAPGSLLSALFQQYRTRRSLPFSPGTPAAPPRSPHRSARQFLHPRWRAAGAAPPPAHAAADRAPSGLRSRAQPRGRYLVARPTRPRQRLPARCNQLRDALIASINKTRPSPEKLCACILQSDLPHFLS